ncbi:MAG: DUF4124 domain-containing protein [Azonexus sp.]
MKALPSLVFGLVTVVAIPAWADTCQWKDSAGRTVISDQPPPGNAKDIRCASGRTSVGGPDPVAATAPKTLAEKDMDFKKRQQEGKEKAEKAAKENSAATDRKENCERAQRQIAGLEAGERVATVDANGERRFLDDTERQAEIERTRRIANESCK